MDVKVKVTNKDQVMKIYTGEDGFYIPSMTMIALNRTAFQIKNALVEEMSKTFDRPTPFTLNALKVETMSPSSARASLRQAAYIVFRDVGGGNTRTENYLTPNVYGGERRLKSFESLLKRVGVMPDGMFAVPGQRAPLDGYGNLSRGFIVQILSYFRAGRDVGYDSNIRDAKKAKMAKGTKKKRGIEYFAIKESGRGLKPGIYRKTAFAFGKSTEPMIMFVKRPSYRKLLKWDEIAQRVLDRNWENNLKEAGMAR